LPTQHSGRAVSGMNRFRSLERWDRGLESHSKHGCQYSVHLFCVYVVLCVGRGLATSCSPVQGVLPTVYRIKKLKSGQGSTKDCRAIIIIIIIIIIKMPLLLFKHYASTTYGEAEV
jgi:hypothetical protein